MAQGLKAFHLVVIGPTFEEFIYRGFFVYFIGSVVGTMIGGILIGLFLCVWLHIYMGPATFVSIVSFFVVAVLLLFSPFGLLAVIAFHSTCNARYALRLRIESLRYLSFLKSSRATRHLAAEHT